MPSQTVNRKEDQVLAEMEELRKIHKEMLPAYKYRLWAEMIVRALIFTLHFTELAEFGLTDVNNLAHKIN